MTAHSDGNGSGWNETLDVDQPHGLDYQEFNDLRIGTRLRMSNGHTDFADNTVGGIHKPGGAGVLGMEITNAGGDITSPVVSDGTYQGRGLIWAYDGSQDARLWCSTEAAESTAATDFTVMLLNPDKQWGGGDVTWAGSHQFDASVDITILNVDASFSVGGNADFSDAIFDGSVDISGALDCSVLFVEQSADFSDAGFVGDVTVTGAIKVDGTATEFGESAGIGLFYDPTTYVGGESNAFGNGFIMKSGFKNATGTQDISFAVPFPNGIVSFVLSDQDSISGASGGNNSHTVTTGVTGATVWINPLSDSAFWQATGH